MGAGRPTSYSKDVLKKAHEYLEQCVDNHEQLVKVENVEKGYTSYENILTVNLPSITGLARYLGVGRQSIYDWKADHVEFSYILEDILAEQEKRLLEGGLSGRYNANIAKLALGKHGYSDKIDQTSGGQPIQQITGMIVKDPEPDTVEVNPNNTDIA